MPALVRPVPTWVLHSLVSAASMSQPADVPIPTMKMAGAVVKSAVILCPVENTNAQGLATRVSAEPAKSALTLAATVARLKRPYYAPTAVMKSRVTKSMPLRTVRMLSRNGLACSVVLTLVIAPSIVAFITARSLAILKTPTLATALALPMSSHVVHAARPNSQKSHPMLAPLARIPSRIARSHV